ncbi:GntR family transcriptional regulator [Nakamurella flava]|uniref:GntR family transcriptional regulator n=1 Tax=Nakamurella flava TaxID=2576308 RepID=A0A4U6QJM6_9ACTN|nr:GntR family transcriptional regulator [Nakamurella flava]TKV60409.1 GntR family transcriptional regulator [Nakamurella flava]
MIEFRIDRRAGVPTYLQIVQQVQQALLLGRLQVGDKLPTAREVVASTAINPNTVLKAYRELEHEGLVQARVGAGTFVTRELARPSTTQHSALGSALGEWVANARRSGLRRDEIEALVKAWLDQEFHQPPVDVKGQS